MYYSLLWKAELYELLEGTQNRNKGKVFGREGGFEREKPGEKKGKGCHVLSGRALAWPGFDSTTTKKIKS